MAFTLDLKTIYSLGALVSLLGAGFMGFVALRISTYAGFRSWFIACLAHAGTMGLLVLQLVTANDHYQVAANFLYLLTAGLTLRGNARFFERRLSRWLDPGLMLLSFGVLALLLLANPERTLRMIAGSAGYAALWWANVWLLLTVKATPLNRRFKDWQAAAYALLATYVSLRSPYLALAGPALDATTIQHLAAFSHVLGTLTNLAFILGYIALTYSRAEERLSAAHAQREELHAAVETERTRLAALVGALPVGVALIGRDGSAQLANESLHRILRLPPDSPPAAALRQLPVEDLIRDGRPQSQPERQLGHGAAAGTWVSLSAAPLTGYGAVVAVADVSALKLTEEKLRQQLAELRRWNSLTLDREDRILALKTEVNQLCHQQGLPPRYTLDPPGPSAPVI